MANVSISTLGVFGWALQTGKDAINTTDADFHYERPQSIDFAVNQLQETLPYTVGGGLLPPGAYKGGAFSSGSFRTNPALADTNAAGNKGFGALLKAMAGGAAYLTGTGTGYTGSGVHVFPGNAAGNAMAQDDFNLEKLWLTVRRLIPGTNYNLGEVYGNVMPSGISIEAVPGQPLTVDVAFQGGASQASTENTRLLNMVTFSENPSWTPAYNAFSSIPNTVSGDFQLPWGTSMDTAGRVQISIASNLTDPRSMITLGRGVPVDFAKMSRNITISWTAIWEDGDLLRQILGNDINATKWSPTVYTSSFATYFTAPDGVSTLGFYAPSVTWTTAPVRLVAGNVVAMDVAGTVIDNSAAPDWFLWMKNQKTTKYG